MRRNMRQPEWVCYECGERWRRGEWFSTSTWHDGVCGVCLKEKPVTEPRDCGYLRSGWERQKPSSLRGEA